MELLHKGFDALDVAYPVHFPTHFVAKLEHAKAQSAKTGVPTRICLGNQEFNVAATGAQGGYSFRLSAVKGREIWFVKKPNSRDPWGVRISVAAVQLALIGLKGVRERIDAKFEALGIPIRPGRESIGRVDFALDFLIPSFELVADNFVMARQFGRMRHADMREWKEGGKSGRTTSVTVGKNPNRQIIVYDKRAEILAKKNPYWPVIWNRNREQAGRPPIDLSDREASQIWRVELRLYKKHLKEDHGVSSWFQLQSMLPKMFNDLLEDVRLTEPTLDKTRCRWPTHALWTRVSEELNGNLSAMRSFASEHQVAEMQQREREQMLITQIAGCTIALASSRNTDFPNLSEFVVQVAQEVTDLFRANPAKTERKLQLAKGKFK